MSSFSIASRRLAKRQGETTQQLIVFQLRQLWFALPIQFAYRVVPIGSVYRTRAGENNKVALHQGHELVVVDIDRLIFKTRSQQNRHLLPGSSSERFTELPQGHMLILQNPQGQFFGIPLDCAPGLRRVANSAFAPVPDAYLEEGNIRCVSALVNPSPEEPPMFLLNLDQLFLPQAALPSGD
jgi:chemotaxis signal transduction protein